MNMNYKRLLYTDFGNIIISVLLGLGLASLFYQVCKDKNCIEFHGPVLNDMDGSIYQHGDECYKYSVVSTPCNTFKNTVQLTANQ